MAQRKARKPSSAMEELRGKTAEELRAILTRPADLTQYLNRIVEERAGPAEHLRLQTTQRTRQRLLCELANTLPEEGPALRFQKQWQSTLRPEPVGDLARLGEELRFIWGRPPINFAEQVLNHWLVGRPARKKPAETGAIPFVCSLGAGLLVPDQEDLRAMLIQGVFENWRHFKMCANTDCAAPHFIAKRRDQVVCDAEICKAEKQRAHALKWWHENRGKAGG
jgi:hypothetical protein